jgi:hypothetical protein
MASERNPLDPFRIALKFVEDSDLLIRIGNAAGLKFDLMMSEDEAYSHNTRVRAVLPRLLAAYDALDDEPRLAAAQNAVAELRKARAAPDEALSDALSRAGWELRESDFVVRSPETREVFFPKGSQWDAFVVLKGAFAEAASSITIIDAYCDGTVFKMIVDRPLDKLHLRILCSRYADAVAAEAKAFTKQYPGVTVEVRRTKDFHDRFIVLDDTACIHVGASIKDAGHTAFMVSRVEDQSNLDAMLKQAQESWKAGTPVV